MDLFSKILRSKRDSAARQTFAEVVDDVIAKATAKGHSVEAPLFALPATIRYAAEEAQRALAQSTGLFSLDGTPSKERIKACWELLCYFTHETLRSAWSRGFTELQMRKLADYLRPEMTSLAVNWFMAHWPRETKEKLGTDFFALLCDRDSQYAQCKSLFSKKPFDPTTVVYQLGCNIVALWSEQNDRVRSTNSSLWGVQSSLSTPMNPAEVMGAFFAAQAGSTIMAKVIRDLLPAVAATIDRVDIELVNRARSDSF